MCGLTHASLLLRCSYEARSTGDIQWLSSSQLRRERSIALSRILGTLCPLQRSFVVSWVRGGPQVASVMERVMSSLILAVSASELKNYNSSIPEKNRTQALLSEESG